MIYCITSQHTVYHYSILYKNTIIMFGFIVFMVIILITIIINTPALKSQNCNQPTHAVLCGTTHNTTRNKFANNTPSNVNIDAITEKNTIINEKTAVTTSNWGDTLIGKSTDLIDSGKRQLRIKLQRKSRKNKLKFSNKVKVRVFDKSTREILGNGGKAL